MAFSGKFEWKRGCAVGEVNLRGRGSCQYRMTIIFRRRQARAGVNRSSARAGSACARRPLSRRSATTSSHPARAGTRPATTSRTSRLAAFRNSVQRRAQRPRHPRLAGVGRPRIRLSRARDTRWPRRRCASSHCARAARRRRDTPVRPSPDQSTRNPFATALSMKGGTRIVATASPRCERFVPLPNAADLVESARAPVDAGARSARYSTSTNPLVVASTAIGPARRLGQRRGTRRRRRTP